jgi:hypothetical protein
MIELPACLLWVECDGVITTHGPGEWLEDLLLDFMHVSKKSAPFQRAVTGRLEGGGLMEDVMHVR